jgi:hypothetical protein
MLTPITGGIPEFHYIDIDNTDGTTTGGWIWLAPDGCNGVSFHNEWTGTYQGTLAIHASNDPRCNPDHPDTANAAFDDITADVSPTDPPGAAGDEMVIISDVRFSYIRLKVTFVGGAGDFDTWFTGNRG